MRTTHVGALLLSQLLLTGCGARSPYDDQGEICELEGGSVAVGGAYQRFGGGGKAGYSGYGGYGGTVYQGGFTSYGATGGMPRGGGGYGGYGAAGGLPRGGGGSGGYSGYGGGGFAGKSPTAGRGGIGGSAGVPTAGNPPIAGRGVAGNAGRGGSVTGGTGGTNNGGTFAGGVSSGGTTIGGAPNGGATTGGATTGGATTGGATTGGATTGGAPTGGIAGAADLGGSSGTANGGADGGVGNSAGTSNTLPEIAGNAGTSFGGAGPWLGCWCGQSNCGTCPSTVTVDRGGYRIDATETTNAEYAQFLAANVSLASQPAVCSWNQNFVPNVNWPLIGKDNLPVTWVDWCDAFAYCAWAGKRLCGAIGAGSAPFASSDDPAVNQWFAACTNGGTSIYPYGSVYDPMACNGADYGMESLVAVGSMSSCQVTGQGIYDMSGNAYEWEDSCATWAGEADVCHTRGGSYFSADPNILRCRTASTLYTRNTVRSSIGFRCCSY